MVKLTKIRWEILVLALSLPLIIGFAGSLVTTPNIPTWYASLNKPFFNPPNWLFAPVWTSLYLLMGLASYLVYHAHRFQARTRPFFRVYILQLLVNSLWSFTFFGLKSPVLALVVILYLWYLIFHSIRLAARLSSFASHLLYPYLAWVSFATLLNLAIVALN